MIKNIKDAQAKKNEVDAVFESAIEENYEEVFIIGMKDKNLHFTNSGYQDIEKKIGLLEMLKHHLLNRDD